MSVRNEAIENGWLTRFVHTDRSLDLFELVLNKGVRIVAVGVIVGEGVEGLSLTTLGNEPTRGLGAEPEEGELGDGRGTLEYGGDAP